MTIKTLSLALMLAFVWTACNNDAPQSATAPGDTMPTAAPEDATQITVPQEATPSATIQSPTAMPDMSQPAAAAGSAKVNPPHGQPGHVCGTPVGSPLDGAAASKSTPAQKPQPTAPTLTAPSGAATVAPGTNPPHGQPGHVCGTPVGTPLDGKQKQ